MIEEMRADRFGFYGYDHAYGTGKDKGTCEDCKHDFVTVENGEYKLCQRKGGALEDNKCWEGRELVRGGKTIDITKTVAGGKRGRPAGGGVGSIATYKGITIVEHANKAGLSVGGILKRIRKNKDISIKELQAPRKKFGR